VNVNDAKLRTEHECPDSAKNGFRIAADPTAAAALATIAANYYAPDFLARGGAAGRAHSAVANGHALAEAAAIGARQGKGHLAEVQLATQFTVGSGLKHAGVHCAPNSVANHPHDDLLLTRGTEAVGSVQVGVGSTGYVATKAAKTQANLLVVDQAALKAAQGATSTASDRLCHAGVSTDPLDGDKLQADAATILQRLIEGNPSVTMVMKLGVAGMSAAKGGVTAFAQSLLFDTVDCLFAGRPFDGAMVERAWNAALNGAARSGLQTYLSVEHFLRQAQTAFDAKLLYQAGRAVAWTGAVADVVVSTAMDLVAWIRGKISFESLLRRFGVNVCEAAGAAAGATGALCGMAALSLLERLPWWATLLLVFGAAWFGGGAGRRIGEAIFSPIASTTPTTPAAAAA